MLIRISTGASSGRVVAVAVAVPIRALAHRDEACEESRRSPLDGHPPLGRCPGLPRERTDETNELPHAPDVQLLLGIVLNRATVDHHGYAPEDLDDPFADEPPG
jgi:hypothetical protein